MTIEGFSRIYRNKIARNKEKRLQAIGEYFATRHNFIVEFRNTDECLRAIIEFVNENTEQREHVLGDISDILFDRYSMGNPFIIYNVSFIQANEDVLIRNVAEVLNQMFNNDVSRDMFDFVRDRVEIDRINGKIKVMCKYKEFAKDLENDIRGEEVVYRGQIPFVIDIRSCKVLINCAYLKAVNTLVKAINQVCRQSMSLRAVNVARSAEQLPNRIGVRFHPLTLLAVVLMLRELNNNNYVINDYLTVNFNNEEAPRVKYARLAGTSLLGDPDVIHRIYRGDKITHFMLNVARILDPLAADLVVDVLFDFRNGLKIQFGESNGGRSVEVAAIELEQIIRDVLDNPNIVAEAEALILANLPNVAVGHGELLRDIISDLRDGLAIILNVDRDIMVDYINRRFNL